MRALGLLSASLVLSYAASAGAVDADPTNYKSIVPTLKAGDTLNLAAGMYTSQLDINGLAGTAAQPITIAGPMTGQAVFTGDACCNTVEITDSSYVVLENVTIDSGGIDGVFGVSAKGGAANVTHDITISGCTFIGQTASQQTDAISTKTPTWGWIIRGNVIDGAGTGLYLGNSDGSDPFVAGVIEGNLIKNTIGYNIEIKFQNPWPTVPGMPTGATSTILRNNVFIKNDQPSPDGDRPNVLIGGLPASGPGSSNLYEIYGNFFFHNPRESLLQASGRFTIHDNVFVDASDIAMNLRDHDLPLVLAHVYDNTVYSAKHGIHFGNAASQGDRVSANLVFADTPIDGPIQTMADNMTDSIANASSYVASPSLTLGSMDFYPLPGKATGAPTDVSAFTTETDYALDFNGTNKGTFTFRGAYAGEGKNPGWQLGDGLKTGGGSGGAPASSATTGTGPGATSATGAGTGGASAANGAGGSANGDNGSSSGCGCRIDEPDGDPRWLVAALALVTVASRVRRDRRGSRRPPIVSI